MLPGEEPIWVAQPVPTLVNRISTPYLFFSVFALLFSALWVAVGGFFALPFLLLFIGIPVGCVWLIYRRMRYTVYIITGQRALVVRPTGRQGWQTLAWPLSCGLVKESVLQADGSGDLILGYETTRDAEGDFTTVPQGFFNLQDVRWVEQLLMNIPAKPQSPQYEAPEEH